MPRTPPARPADRAAAPTRRGRPSSPSTATTSRSATRATTSAASRSRARGSRSGSTSRSSCPEAPTSASASRCTARPTCQRTRSDMGLKDRFNGDLLTGADAADEREVAARDGGASYGIGYFKRKLLEEVALAELVKLGPSQRRARLESLVADLLSREGPVLASAQRSSLIRQIVDESLGLGVLEPLLADETITEIMVNGPNEVWVERHGNLHKIDARFSGEAELMQTIDRIVSTVNRRVDESSPMVDARLPSGERVNVIIPPLALRGPTMTIRRFPRLFTLDELVSIGSLDEPILYLLAGLVQAKANVIVSGATGTGKTTLLNALSGLIPETERIITIEDSAELQLQQPHVIRLESRPPNVEGKGRI